MSLKLNCYTSVFAMRLQIQRVLLILYNLAEKPRFVNELIEIMDIPQSTMSRHLRVLRDRSLVDTERDGSAIRYFLTDKRIIEALDIMRAILATQLAQSAEIARTLSE